jgi:hypothetical protein
MAVLQKIKNGTTMSSSSPNADYISKRNETSILRRYLHSQVHHGIIHNSQDLESTSDP